MRGHTLIELAFVLFIVGVATASATPPALRLADRTAVVAAREAVVALIVEARLAAVESGGARVRIEGSPWQATALAQGATLRSVALQEEYGVSLELGNGRTDVDLAYDALGLGRVASQTVVFRRGDASAELIVSSYGRLRRR